MGCLSVENKKRKPKPNEKQYDKKEDQDEKINKEIYEYIESKKEDNLNEDNIKDYLYHLCISYNSAMEYFKKNDFKYKEFDATRKCRKIKDALDLLKKGESQKIKKDELPQEITSEYITGSSIQQRKAEIEKIIKYI